MRKRKERRLRDMTCTPGAHFVHQLCTRHVFVFPQPPAIHLVTTKAGCERCESGEGGCQGPLASTRPYLPAPQRVPAILLFRRIPSFSTKSDKKLLGIRQAGSWRRCKGRSPQADELLLTLSTSAAAATSSRHAYSQVQRHFAKHSHAVTRPCLARWMAQPIRFRDAGFADV